MHYKFPICFQLGGADTQRSALIYKAEKEPEDLEKDWEGGNDVCYSTVPRTQRQRARQADACVNRVVSAYQVKARAEHGSSICCG